jgi:tetratricopeptide (TPR) repeat protein
MSCRKTGSDCKRRPHVGLTEELYGQLTDAVLSSEERTAAQCLLASRLIHVGQYEEARKVLPFPGIGKRPNIEGLSPQVEAELLLQCGVLSSWLGSVQQVRDAQERSKDLLTEAHRIFLSLHKPDKVSETEYELGLCYWRLGAFEEARIVFQEALGRDIPDELKAKIHIRRCAIEFQTGHLYESRRILEEARPFFENTNDGLKGRFHGQLGLVLRRFGSLSGNAEYFDRAIIEYTAAIYHYENAGHIRYCAINLNNLAFLLLELKRYKEAHRQIRYASKLLREFHDEGLLAQVSETEARIYLAEGRYQEGMLVIKKAVSVLEKGDENALYADALIWEAILLSRLHYHNKSIKTLIEAVKIAEAAGALTNAGQGLIALIEEHHARITKRQLVQAYVRAERLLRESKDHADRLRNASILVVAVLSQPRLSDPDFSLKKAVNEFEAGFIEQALEEEEGSITKAAKKLGLTHQTFTSMLQGRHRNLLPKRTALVKRRRSIIKYK